MNVQARIEMEKEARRLANELKQDVHLVETENGNSVLWVFADTPASRKILYTAHYIEGMGSLLGGRQP